VLGVIMGSDPEVMRTALAQMDAKFGGPVELVKAKFGVTDAEIARMRSLYLV
jgi:protein-tyrosine phosphatase